MRLFTGSGGKGAILALVIGLLVGVLTYAALSPSRLTDPAGTTEALDPSSPAESPAPSASATAPRTRPASPPAVDSSSGPPSRVELPSLGEALPVVPVGVDGAKAMQIPEDPGTAGWYRFGPDPASATGASVISAHTDTADEVGPLARLDQLEPGDDIRVTVGDEHLVYVVRRVDHHAKEALDADALFSRSGPPRLHLVSCGGEWDPATRSYEDNVIAVATRTTEPTTYSGSRDG